VGNPLRKILETQTFSSNQIEVHAGAIHRDLLGRSQYLDLPNFSRIHPSDLEWMFYRYDRLFFGDALQGALGQAPLTFKFSSRMTSAAGMTTAFDPMRNVRYDIKISSQLLFECFVGNDHRPIVVAGRICLDRLDALQRIMEHEVVHLAEMLAWSPGESSCTSERFQSIARRLFGHEHHRHQLILRRERASVQFGIVPGCRVRFQYDGQSFVGVVNRITKRATVLVEDPQGTPYRNGKRYQKYFVPIPMLQKLESSAADAE
jgi:hypothetical protein